MVQGSRKINPVTYVMEAMRAMTLEGWEWPTILPGAGIIYPPIILTSRQKLGARANRP